MNKLIQLSLVVIVFFSSCKEFIEPSITNQKLNLVAPANRIETTNYQQTFWWETLEDAFQYRLQIVNPSFGNINQLVLDTVVKTDKFIYTLEPGNYEWRVRGENGSSQTAYTTYRLVVHPSSLQDQVVQLVAPTNGLITTNSAIQYEWLKLFGTTQYRLQIDNKNFADENNLLLNQTTPNLIFTHTLTADGNYQYRIRAENAMEISKWSAIRSFTYDGTPPEKVVLTTPTDKQMVSKPVTLRWNALTDTEKYELTVYKSDATTVFNSSYPQMVTTNTATFNLGDLGDSLYWRVRAVDKAGNKGPYSELFNFTLQ